MNLCTSLMTALGLGLSTLPDCGAEAQPVIWHGEAKSPPPLGKLLSANPGYYGPTASVGVSYRYAAPPGNPSDPEADGSTGSGRLLDGKLNGNWSVPVGINHQPLVIDFTFSAEAQITEVCLGAGRLPELRLAKLEVRSDAEQPWQEVDLKLERAGEIIRLKITQPVAAQAVRVTVQSESSVTYLDEVWIWGEPTAPLSAAPSDHPRDPTVLDPSSLARWRNQTGFRQSALTWQTVERWRWMEKDALQHGPPAERANVAAPVKIRLAQNEREPAALLLINASGKAQTAHVQLGPVKTTEGKEAPALTAHLKIAGAIHTKRWGNILRPLFSADNHPGEELMDRYLLNSGTIRRFPELSLPANGTALLWITVNSAGAEPGRYLATLSAGALAIPLEIEVAAVTLPEPETWVRAWAESSYAHRRSITFPPFRSSHYVDHEIDYQHAMGVSAWRGFPAPGSFPEAVRKHAQATGVRKQHFITPFSLEVMNKGYRGQIDPAAFDEAYRDSIRSQARELVAKAESYGLSYEGWSVELWDEPTIHNMAGWVAIARLIKEADPRIQLYMNPLFWTREGTNPGFVDDATQITHLKGWYNELVDLSVPILGQADERTYPRATAEFYDHQPRAVRAFFVHPPGGRTMAWEAFRRGYNGWGFYSYYQPRNNPWDDFDHPKEFDYQIVYPGPHAPIPTIESEAIREGWDDYRLLHHLQSTERTAALKNALGGYLKAVEQRRAEVGPQRRIQPLSGDTFTRLRDEALKAASQP